MLTYEGTRGNIHIIEIESIHHTFYVNSKTSQVQHVLFTGNKLLWAFLTFVSICLHFRHAMRRNTLSLPPVVVHLFNLKSSLPLCDPTLVSARPCSILLMCTDAERDFFY